MSNTLQFIFYFLLAIAVGASISYYFYYKKSSNQFSKSVTFYLFALRALTIALLVFILLNPRISFTLTEIQKPKLIFAYDNSESIKYLNDSSRLQQNIDLINNQIELLSKMFDIQNITFGERVCDTCPLQHSENETNISALFDHIDSYYQVNKPNAIVLITDGLVNTGEYPTRKAEKSGIPVLSVVMADTVAVIDYWIASIQNNPMVYSNNKFQVDIEVRRTDNNIVNSEIEIYRKGTLVEKIPINFPKDEQRIKTTVMLTAPKAGVYQYEVRLKADQREKNIENNKAYFAIEVIDAETDILLLYNAPSPDIGFLRQSIEQNKVYRLDVQHVSSFSGDFNKYSAIIFMHLPDGDFGADRFVVEAVKQNRSIWFFVGSKTNTTMLNQLNLGWNFSRTGKKLDLVYPVENQFYNYFIIPQLLLSVIDKLPPLYAQFGRWNVVNSSEIAIFQRIGSVETENPLLLTTIAGNRRIALTTGEGLWRWNIFLNKNYGNASALNDLIGQVIQFLSVKPTTSPLKISVKPIWAKTTNIYVDAFVYNMNYQLINDKKVDLLIEGEDTQSISFSMKPYEQYYRTYIGTLPVGTYSVTGNYKTDSATYTDKKTFAVADINIEKQVSIPDITFLKNISGNSDENIFYNTDLDELSDRISKLIDSKPRQISNRTISDIVVYTFLLFLIVSFATIEWFLRKYHGQR
ncbi:MAG TPA: hypothetical protein PKW37_04190 [Salinivirgaceae bacterium]|nr:hypothetical protein [Salinivirgaceae bacterium]